MNQIPRPLFKRKRLAIALAALTVLGADQSEAGLENRLNLQGLVINSQAGTVANSQLNLHGLVIDNEVGVVNRKQLQLEGLVIDSVTGAMRGDRLNLQGLVIDSASGIVRRERLSLDGYVIDNQVDEGGSERLGLQGLVINNETSVASYQQDKLQGLVISSETKVPSYQQVNLRGLVIDSQSGIGVEEIADYLAEPDTQQVEVVFPPLSLNEKNTLVAILTRNGHSAFDFGKAEIGTHPELTSQEQQSLVQESEAPFPEAAAREGQAVILSSIKSDADAEISDQKPTGVFEEDEPIIVSKEGLSERSRKSLSIFEPSIASMVQYDDNVFLDVEDKQAETLAVIRPQVRYQYEKRKSKLDLNYALEAGKYIEFGENDYVDHDLLGGWEVKFDQRRKMKLEGRYRNSHENRYDTRSDDTRAALVGNPTRYKDAQFGIGYAHGNRLDRTRIEVRGSARQLRLDDGATNRSQDDRDYKTLNLGYFWHIRRRMSLFAEGRYKTIDYREVSRDSDQVRWAVGAEIQFRKRLTGTIRFGIEDKEFDVGDSNDDYSDNVWDASLTWHPKQNTMLKFETAKLLSEVEEIGEIQDNVFVEQKHIGIDWIQEWTPKLTTQLTARLHNDDFQGIRREDEQEVGREDEMTWFRFRLNYLVKPNLTIGLDGIRESRKFNSSVDADRSTITFRAHYSF